MTGEARPSVAMVILFKPSGKYYTEERWRIPDKAIGPYDMERSPDFRRIGGLGAVLIETQEPWGYPHLFPADPAQVAHHDLANEIENYPGPDPSPANPAWWAGYVEARSDLARLVREKGSS